MDADTELKKSCINPEVYSENLEKDLSAISFYGVEEKCTEWLDSCTSDDVLSVCSKLTETSDGSLFTDTTENSEMDSGYVLESDDIIVENKICCEDVSDIFSYIKMIIKDDRILASFQNRFGTKSFHHTKKVSFGK